VARPQERKFLVHFSLVRTSSARSRRISGTVQAANPGDPRRAKGVSIKTDNGRTVPYMRGWRAIRLLRNAEVLIAPHSLGPAAIAGRCGVSGNTTSPSCGTDRTASLGELRYGGSGRGPWHIAGSKLSLGLSKRLLQSLGLPTLVETR